MEYVFTIGGMDIYTGKIYNKEFINMCYDMFNDNAVQFYSKKENILYNFDWTAFNKAAANYTTSKCVVL